MKTVSNSPSIFIKINGECKSVPQNTSILKLLELFNLNKERVVIELNRNILLKSHFKNTILKGDDKVEIVTFVGGG